MLIIWFTFTQLVNTQVDDWFVATNDQERSWLRFTPGAGSVEETLTWCLRDKRLCWWFLSILLEVFTALSLVADLVLCSMFSSEQFASVSGAITSCSTEQAKIGGPELPLSLPSSSSFFRASKTCCQSSSNAFAVLQGNNYDHLLERYVCTFARECTASCGSCALWTYDWILTNMLVFWSFGLCWGWVCLFTW